MSSPSLSISLSPRAPFDVWVGSPGKPAFQLASAHHDALCLEDRLVLCEQVSDPKNSSQTSSEVWICRKPLRQDICPAVESSLGPVRDGGFHNREWDSEKMSMQLSLLPMVQRQYPQNCTIRDSKTRQWSPQKSRVDEQVAFPPLLPMAGMRRGRWRGMRGCGEKTQESPRGARALSHIGTSSRFEQIVACLAPPTDQ